MGFGAGPIPWTAMSEYVRVYEFEEEQRENLFYLVREMDQAFLKFSHKKSESKVKSSKGKLGQK